MGRRLIVAVGALVASLLIQVTIVNGLELPGGGVPDLVLLCVIAIGVAGGPRCGLAAGFGAGLALDVAPPTVDLVGQYALVFCLAGYAGGRLRPIVSRSVAGTLAFAAVIAVAAEVLTGCLSLVLGSPAAGLSVVAATLPFSSLYDAVVGSLLLVAAVRLAVALGVSFDAAGDSSPLEVPGRARPAGLPALPAARGRRRGPRVAKPRSGTPVDDWLAGPQVRRIQFGPGGEVGRHRTDERARPQPGVPQIAFGSGELVPVRRPVGRVPQIAFGSGGPVPVRRPVGRVVPQIAFGAPRRVPGPGGPAGHVGGSAAATWGPHGRRGSSKGSALSFAGSGGLVAAGGGVAAGRSASAGRGAGVGRGAGGGLAARPVPRIVFTDGGGSWQKGRTGAGVRKVVKMRAGRRVPRWLPWSRRAGGRSTVWRIGSTRTVNHR